MTLKPRRRKLLAFLWSKAAREPGENQWVKRADRNGRFYTAEGRGTQQMLRQKSGEVKGMVEKAHCNKSRPKYQQLGNGLENPPRLKASSHNIVVMRQTFPSFYCYCALVHCFHVLMKRCTRLTVRFLAFSFARATCLLPTFYARKGMIYLLVIEALRRVYCSVDDLLT